MRFIHCIATAVVFTMTGTALAERTLDGTRPLVIGHRGACGYVPEHTLEAYRLAIAQGADFIEADLVSTKDGVLIARHEPMLAGSTDVASRPEFAARRRTRVVDGIPTTDWFACDFTLAEIKQLRARQSMPGRPTEKDGLFAIPTLQEFIDLAKSESERVKRPIGLYIETKSSVFHFALGLPLEDRLLDALTEAGWSDRESPVILESFETASLKYLRPRTKLRLVQLIDGDDVDPQGRVILTTLARPYDFAVLGDKRNFQDMLTKEGLTEIRTYADGVGPWKPYLIPTRNVDLDDDGKPDDLNRDGALDERDRLIMSPTNVVADAHAAGLFVHTWTLRNDPSKLAASYDGDGRLECQALFDLGVDGLFSDFPDTAVAARAGEARPR